MSEPIVKYVIEEMPLYFDFAKRRLGKMARGAAITEVTALTVAPTGDADDLAVGTVGDALISHIGVGVQVRAVKGRAGVRYVATCTATVSHAGATYPFTVQLVVHVR